MINRDKLSKLIEKRKLKDHEEEIFLELNNTIKKLLDIKSKEIKNKKRVITNDNAKERIAAKELFTKKEISKFPAWVQKDIDKAQIVGKSKKVIQVSGGKKYHISNKLNDLSGGEWTFFLNSVINTRYSTNGEEGFAHHIRKIHPSPKPPQLMQQIIEFFTKENELVLDYFMGVGGTLLGASLCNRRAIGIDLNMEYINVYKKSNECLRLKKQVTIHGNAIKLLKSADAVRKKLNNEKVSLILIDPPYGDMLSRPKTGQAIKDNKDASATPFTNLKEDLGNMSWSEFRSVFRESIVNSMKLLKNRGHIVIFIKDLQPKEKELNLLHADIIMDLNKIRNLKYLGTRIWADQSVNLYPYGYPFSYVSNQIHQYIMIFKKD